MRAAPILALALLIAGCAVAPAEPPPVRLPAQIPEPPPPPRAVEAWPRPLAAAWPHPPLSNGNLSALIHNDDYPAAARAARIQGNTAVILAVGVNGRVTGCTITQSSGSSLLDSTTCRILRSRARFAPARDAAGNPQTGVVRTVIAWRIPPG
ncbi:MAG TPA: energy transducer TonB [Allosphingosinicella sp.]|jgi:protein TonB